MNILESLQRLRLTNSERSRPHPVSARCNRDSVQSRASNSKREYRAISCSLQQNRPEAQFNEEEAKPTNGGSGLGSGISKKPLERQSGTVARPKEAAQEQSDADKQEPKLSSGEGIPAEAEFQNSVRGLLRKVPNSVAIVTVKSTDPDTKQHVPMGIAVSSLSSVTLDPPTISFNIKQRSKTLDAIRAANGLFRIHFPVAEDVGAKAVELFCHGNHTAAYKSRAKEIRLLVPSSREERGATASAAPQIRNASIQGAMECTLTHEFPIADHVILAARVDSVENLDSKAPTLLYVDGRYACAGKTIATHAKPEMFAQSEGNFTIWDCPSFPGDKERQDYVEQIKNLLNKSPDSLSNMQGDIYRQFALKLPYHPSFLGINLDMIVAEQQRQNKCKKILYPYLQDLPIFADFYGRVDPSQRNKLLSRAARLVKNGPQYLTESYRSLLNGLNFSSSCRDFLPSDIMNHLRAEGLVDSKVALEAKSSEFISRKTYDIQQLENLENRLRDHLRDLDYEEAAKTPFENITAEFGEHKYAALCFQKCRGRLLSEAHPSKFTTSEIDIAGHISPEEIRVVVSRIVQFLMAGTLGRLRRMLAVPKFEVLRITGVHPTITGMDVEYFFIKIHHLLSSNQNSNDFYMAMDRMLKAWFDKTIDWDDLETRVRNLVETAPMRAISWSNTDQLAAMGLHWMATVTVPVQSGEDTQQPLYGSPILATLIAKELKSLSR